MDIGQKGEGRVTSCEAAGMGLSHSCELGTQEWA